MGHKGGGKYFRKHFVDTSEEEKIRREIEENPLSPVIYDDVGFLTSFHKLSHKNQILAYQTLVRLAHPSNMDIESREDAMYKIHRIAKSIGLECVERQNCFLSKDERLIIRMDFYGSIDRIKRSERKRKLSEPYLDLIAKPLSKRPKMSDYDFNTAPMWPLFAKFTGFRKIENDLKRYLVIHKIDPQILSLMNIRDFSDLIFKAFLKDEDRDFDKQKNKDSDAKYLVERYKTVRLRKLKELQKTEQKLDQYLIKSGIDPDVMSAAYAKARDNMEWQVKQEVLWSKTNNDDDTGVLKVTFQSPLSVRQAFVQEVAHMFGDQISTILLSKGYDERYVKSMLTAMQRYGTTRAEKLVITELEFTDQILKDFKKAKINCKHFKKGDSIPQPLINYLVDTNQGDLIAARDENGHKLVSTDCPSFEVHHKHAVSVSGDLSNVASINYFDNLCLVLEDIHAHVLHGMDIIQDNQRDAYSRRTEFIKEDTIFMAGLNSNDCLYYSFANRNSLKKRSKQDSHVIASYDECYKQLCQNQTAYNTAPSTDSNQPKQLDVDSYVSLIKKTYKNRRSIIKTLNNAQVNVITTFKKTNTK
ncbi:MAG: hypothetical protein J5896_05410 [Alphaproteobacteria bacterium]|nr:hypothetical protein [Alphaproteobacteria bacterium]